MPKKINCRNYSFFPSIKNKIKFVFRCRIDDKKEEKSVYYITFVCMRCRDSDMGGAKRNRIHAVI